MILLTCQPQLGRASGVDNYLLLTDEVTEVPWGYVPVPPLCGPQFLPLVLRSFSALTIDAFIIAQVYKTI